MKKLLAPIKSTTYYCLHPDAYLALIPPGTLQHTKTILQVWKDPKAGGRIRKEKGWILAYVDVFTSGPSVRFTKKEGQSTRYMDLSVDLKAGTIHVKAW
jgi:hypothetical protein